jgi:hypothetical protein
MIIFRTETVASMREEPQLMREREREVVDFLWKLCCIYNGAFVAFISEYWFLLS